MRHTVGEYAARSGVVRLRRRLAVPKPDAAVGRPQMAQEQADLGIAGRVDGGRNALLVRPQVFYPEFAEPGVQWVPAAMRAVVWRRQVRMPPRLLGHPAWRNAELRQIGRASC